MNSLMLRIMNLGLLQEEQQETIRLQLLLQYQVEHLLTVKKKRLLQQLQMVGKSMHLEHL